MKNLFLFAGQGLLQGFLVWCATRVNWAYFGLEQFGIVGASLANFVLFFKILRSNRKNQTDFHYSHSPLNEQIAERLKSLDWSVSGMFYSGLLQTIAAGALRNTPDIKFARELIETQDGGVIALDWATPTPLPEKVLTTPIVVILHGLTGGSHESYVRHFITFAQQRGYRSVVFNFRGAGDSPLRSSQTYCGAYTDDTALVMKHVQLHAPEAPVFAVGFSLGANILTKYCGELGEESPLAAAVSISNPFDFLISSKHLEKQQFLTKTLCNNCKRFVRKHYEILKTNQKQIDVDHVLSNAKTLRDFDVLATAPLFGYESVEHYYFDASSSRKLHNIRRPMLLLNAVDDPLIPEEALPFSQVENNRHLFLVVSQKGGHVAWLKKTGGHESLMEEAAVGFLDVVLEERLKSSVPKDDNFVDNKN